MADYLFAAPWWLLLTLAVIGVSVAWSGNQRQDAKTRNLGLVVLAVAALMFAARFFYETDEARVTRLNRELVQAVPGRDWSKFADLLDADATLGDVSGSFFNDRTAIVNGAKSDVDRWGLKTVSITNTQVKQDKTVSGSGGDITVDITVLSTQTVSEGFIPAVTSNWRMVWDRQAGQWHCRSITCLGIGSDKSGNVGRYIR